MSDQQTLAKKAKQLANTECADWNTNLSAYCAMTAFQHLSLFLVKSDHGAIIL